MRRRTLEPVIKNLTEKYPIVTLTGPRQSGKTTLCKMAFPDREYINLEIPDHRRFAIEDPRGFLSSAGRNVILDEIQRVPELTSYLQAMVDEDQTPGQFILTGSQDFNVKESLSQSLAGRTGLLTLLPFDCFEIQEYQNLNDANSLILHGFYPRPHHMGIAPTQAMGDYFETYVQRDVRQLMNIKDMGAFEKFVQLCAGRVGQLLNLNSLSNETGISHSTARQWISILEASYIIFQLRPWYANISKRLVKTPKIYFWDVGLAAYLLGLQEEQQVARDPLRGNLFENMVISEIFKQHYHQGLRPRISFYRDNTGNEVDLILESGRELFPMEIKSGQTVTKQYFHGLNKLAKIVPERIKKGFVLYGGTDWQLRSDWEVRPLVKLPDLLANIRSLTI